MRSNWLIGLVHQLVEVVAVWEISVIEVQRFLLDQVNIVAYNSLLRSFIVTFQLIVVELNRLMGLLLRHRQVHHICLTVLQIIVDIIKTWLWFLYHSWRYDSLPRTLPRMLRGVEQPFTDLAGLGFIPVCWASFVAHWH